MAVRQLQKDVKQTALPRLNAEPKTVVAVILISVMALLWARVFFRDKLAAEVNSQMENIGARRLHTIMERLLESISFLAPELASTDPVTIDAAYVRKQLEDIVKNEDLSKYIL